MAQKKDVASFLTLTMGPGFPTGDFGKKDLKDESGLASTGAFLDLSYGYKFFEYSGLTIGLRGGSMEWIYLNLALPGGLH